ncbi:hypothetical protein [Microbispora sp. H10670]|uniref:hypothetical protein n=1 Tax=Microbispora sp. H10670 TaxID=2729108 RepID=UPI0021758511|nr:hypothetical protein [Microbispora sp. H10670]
MKDITLRDLQDLPPTLDLMTAARILGIGRTKAYELAKKDSFPCGPSASATSTASPLPTFFASSVVVPRFSGTDDGTTQRL